MLAATLLWRTIITGKTDVVRTSCSSVLLPRDEMVAVNSPGPGAYSPTSAFHSASSPRYSMGLKNATPERNKQLFRSASTTDVGTYADKLTRRVGGPAALARQLVRQAPGVEVDAP